MLRRIVLAGLFALAAAARLSAGDSPFGVNAHAPGGAALGLEFDRVAEAGIGWVRIDFVWALIETTPDHFDWSAYDAIVAAAEARGLSVLGILAYTPGWATDAEPLSGPPRSVADWEDFCFRAARRYRGRVLDWELWNEPNQKSFWSGTRQQYIDWILIPGAAAVHAADSNARAGGPALAHLESAHWYAWLLEVLQKAGGREVRSVERIERGESAESGGGGVNLAVDRHRDGACQVDVLPVDHRPLLIPGAPDEVGREQGDRQRGGDDQQGQE